MHSFLFPYCVTLSSCNTRWFRIISVGNISRFASVLCDSVLTANEKCSSLHCIVDSGMKLVFPTLLSQNSHFRFCIFRIVSVTDMLSFLSFLLSFFSLIHTHTHTHTHTHNYMSDIIKQFIFFLQVSHSINNYLFLLPIFLRFFYNVCITIDKQCDNVIG